MKKVFALLLALLLVIPMIASCGNDKGGATKQTSNAINGNKVDKDDPYAEINAKIDKYVDELASNRDFNGETFTYIGAGDQMPQKDEETGDLASDAFYYRQRDIEEKFNVDWVNFVPDAGDTDTSVHPIVEHVKQSVMAGTKAYDLGYGIPASSVQPLFVDNMLTDVSEYTVIDLDREWWTPTIRDTYSVAGGIFFLNGSIVSSHYVDTYCVLFNKQVAEDYGIEDMYSLVKSGEWTFDKMFEIAEVIPTNANGSGAYRYMDPNGMAVLFAHDMTVTKFTDDGHPYVEDNVSMELSAISDKFSAVFGDETITANTWDNSGYHEDMMEKYGYENYYEMFVDDGALFYFATTRNAAYLRTQEVEFGILPIPKGDKNQDNYISYADEWTGYVVYVPKCTASNDRTDVLLEAMAALGYKYLKPANYDNILKGRTTFDNESKEMIDIIFATKKYDLIGLLAPDSSWNGDGSFVRSIKGAIEETNNAFTSRYFLQARMVNSNIKMLIADVESGN